MPLNKPIASFKDLKVWVIGASSGIGEACARQFLEGGAKVALSARRKENLEVIAAKFDLTKSLVIPVDVNSTEEIKAGFESIKNSWGQIDLLLYVSGIYEPIRASGMNLEKVERTVRTNIMGPMAACATVLPDFIANQTGGVAIVSSVAGYSGLPKSLAYGPTKAALINFCESLYYDLKPLGVSVYMINPGFVKTEATAKNDFHMPGLIGSEEAAQHILNGIATGDFDIHFPKGFTRFLKFLRILPYPIYFYLLKKFVKI